MKKRGICLLPDACYLSELNVPGKPNRTNLGECAAIQRFLSTHPNENLAILTPYRNQRALLAGTAKKSSYPQEVSLTVHRAQGREWDTVLFSVVDTTGKFFTTTLNPQNCGTQIINTAVTINICLKAKQCSSLLRISIRAILVHNTEITDHVVSMRLYNIYDLQHSPV